MRSPDPAGLEGSFESHICCVDMSGLACFWASLLERSNAVVGLADGSVPVFVNGTIKSFIGGDFDHTRPRNSSLALIECSRGDAGGGGAQPHCEYSDGSGWAVTLLRL